ncbi:hypothetical protein PRK78_004251 [Emydomyces testavorans]|uniref:Uncharacterized protein n=1 Tax=Emydomyces testavorans TaxID=2070801 RepID=A0AAF0IJ38_9EURO|nr:hypothetical protein PRK78_004251 [Emydomyces testavorans]
MALLSSLGKSESVTSPADVTRASMTARWIVFTAFETALEVAPIARVISQVLRLQRFLQYERPNIGIVPTIISEELWASISLFSASIPVLMRVAKRFTTSREVGDRTASGSRYNKSSRSKKTPDQSFEMASSNSHSNWQPHRNKAVSYLNEDNYTAAVLPGKSAPESINSTSESQVGILREVQVEVSSLHVQKRIPGISVAS